MKSKTAMVALVGVLALAGCGQRMTTAEMVGAGVGLVVGGVVGYQFGGGTGQMLATAFGAAAGGTAGYVAGRRLSGSDRAEYERTKTEALEGARDGEVRSWSNPETGNGGMIRPVRSFAVGEERFCRDFRAAVAFDKDVTSGTGTACRERGGPWMVVADAFG